MIKKRNIVNSYLLSIVTLGIYAVYWLVQQKEELNKLGGKIPTAWLIIVPIANLFWLWEFCGAYSKFVEKDDNRILWFLVYVIVGVVMPGIVQESLNKLSEAE